MKIALIVLPSALLLSALAHAPKMQPAKDWADRLDASSAKFTSAQASFHKVNFTKFVNSSESQDGVTYARRGKGGTEVGIMIPNFETVIYKNGTATIFNAGAKCSNKYDSGKNKGTIESLLALSFGASGKELNAAWTVTDKGPDLQKMDGVTVEVLDLVPKDPGLRGSVKSITLWTDLDTAIAHKQVVYTPEGNTQTGTYSNIVLNKTVNTKPFEFKDKPCSKQ